MHHVGIVRCTCAIQTSVTLAYMYMYVYMYMCQICISQSITARVQAIHFSAVSVMQGVMSRRQAKRLDGNDEH